MMHQHLIRTISDNNCKAEVGLLPLHRSKVIFRPLKHMAGAIKSSQVSPNARRRAKRKGGGEKEKYMYVHTNCTSCRRLSEKVAAAFTLNRHVNVGKSEAKHPIGPHFLQQFPSRPKLCTCRTFSVLCPKFVVGAHMFSSIDTPQTSLGIAETDKASKFETNVEFADSEDSEHSSS